MRKDLLILSVCVGHQALGFLPSSTPSRHHQQSALFGIAYASAESVAQSLWETHDLFQTKVHAVVTCPKEAAEGISCGSLPPPPVCRLAYMPCRNRGEILRLMLEEAQVPYELEVVGFQKWQDSVKASTPQGKLPVLRHWKSQEINLGQEQAITRFLA